MGKHGHRRHHLGENHRRRSFDFRKHKNKDTIFFVKLGIIGVFLFFAYQYYIKNSVDAMFTMLIQLPLINEVVRGWIYWVLVVGICVGIWVLVDYMRK